MTSASSELSLESRTADKHIIIYSCIQLVVVTTSLLPFVIGSLLVSSCTRAVRWICILISISHLVCSLLGLLGRKYTPSRHRTTAWKNLLHKMKSLGQGFGILIISVFIFFELSVLFGAPFTSLLEETTAFAILLTVLATLPGCLTWGVRPNIWAKVLLGSGPENTYEKSVMQVGIFSIIGAWVGAFPIPLDWDRPWQIWPISCSIGAMLGYVAGNVYNIYCRYKKLQHKKRKRT